MAAGPCPVFAPNNFRRWKRETKFPAKGPPGASVTRILGKLICDLSLSVKAGCLINMEQSESNTAERSPPTATDIAGARFGQTDSERACSRRTAFGEFKRESQSNYKDSRARFARCVSHLGSLVATTGEEVAFSRSIRAIRLLEGRRPIAMSAWETRHGRLRAQGLRGIIISVSGNT